MKFDLSAPYHHVLSSLSFSPSKKIQSENRGKEAGENHPASPDPFMHPFRPVPIICVRLAGMRHASSRFRFSSYF